MCLILAGCNGKGYRDAESILEEGWANVRTEDVAQSEQIYCYKTLGTPDCYTTPDPSRASQLVSLVPAPKSHHHHAAADAPYKSSVDHDIKAYEKALSNAQYHPSFAEQTQTVRHKKHAAIRDEIAMAELQAQQDGKKAATDMKRAQKELSLAKRHLAELNGAPKGDTLQAKADAAQKQTPVKKRNMDEIIAAYLPQDKQNLGEKSGQKPTPKVENPLLIK